MEQDKKTDKQVNIPVVKIDLPKIDVTEYVGKKTKIESADTYQGQFGMYLKIQTKVVATIGKGDKAVELRGSKILGLQQDADGIYGYGEGTKLDLFLKKYKAKEPKDLIGKEVVLQTRTSESGTEFLTFN